MNDILKADMFWLSRKLDPHDGGVRVYEKVEMKAVRFALTANETSVRMRQFDERHAEILQE